MCGMLMVRLIQTSQYLNHFESCAVASSVPAKSRNNGAGEQHYNKPDAMFSNANASALSAIVQSVVITQ
jgi:hypothetical protein